MILDHFKLLFKLYYRPLAAMSGIIDSGNWVYGAFAVAVLSAILQVTLTARIYTNFEAVPYRVKLPPRPAQSAQTKNPPPATAPDDDPDEADYREYTQMRREPLPVVGSFGWWFFTFSPLSIYGTVVTLALLYVPGTILVMVFLEHLGSFGVVLRRDYGPLLACTLMAWTAAHLPCALVGLALNAITLRVGGLFLRMFGFLGLTLDFSRLSGALAFMVWMLGTLYFGVLMVCAVRTVFGVTFGKAISAIGISWLSMIFESKLLLTMASPFILYWAYVYFRGDIGDINSAFRTRQSLHHNLVAATVNPHDGEAHYQLGLIYQHRRQYTEAIARFKRSVEIDPREIDAHYQLGRIAREQGRLQEAITHFDAVVSQDDKHCHSEIWREIGAAYSAAGMYEEARAALEKYTQRRPYDPEGLYYLGDTLNKLAETVPARENFEHCIEAVKTMPYYRRGQMRRWSKLAQEQLRNQK